MNIIKNKVNVLLRTGFFYVFGSSVLNKIISFISSVVLVRILTKSEYGIFTYAWNIYSIVLLFSGMGMDSAILQLCSEHSGDEEYARRVCNYGTRFGIGFNVLLTVFCVVPTIFFWGRKPLGYGYDFAWFVVLYFVAAYIRLYGIPLSGKKCALGYFLIALLGFASNIVLGVVTKIVFGEPKRVDLMFVYNSIPFFAAAVMLFAAFTKLQVKGKVLTAISRLGTFVFGAYLISDHALIRDVLWKHINLPEMVSAGIGATVGSVLAVAGLIMVVGCGVEAVRLLLMRLLKLDALLSWADKMFARLVNKIDTI